MVINMQSVSHLNYYISYMNAEFMVDKFMNSEFRIYMNSEFIVDKFVAKWIEISKYSFFNYAVCKI